MKINIHGCCSKIKLILFFAVIIVTGISAQNDNPFYDIYFKSKEVNISSVPYHYRTRVNLLDHFFKRFDMELNIEGQDINPNDIAPLLLLPGAKNNWDNIRRQMLFFVTNPPAFYKDSVLFNSFVDTIIDKNISIRFEDGQWKAICIADVLLDDNPQEVILTMNIVSANKGYKWLIEDVVMPKTSKLIFPESLKISIKPDSTVFLNPMSHETNFIEMSRLFNNDSIISILSPNFDRQLKNKLFFNVKTGKIKFNYIKNITYAFFQVPGFVFFVDYFNRKELNSGWLIEDIVKKEKNIDNLLFLRHKFKK